MPPGLRRSWSRRNAASRSVALVRWPNVPRPSSATSKRSSSGRLSAVAVPSMTRERRATRSGRVASRFAQRARIATEGSTPVTVWPAAVSAAISRPLPAPTSRTASRSRAPARSSFSASMSALKLSCSRSYHSAISAYGSALSWSRGSAGIGLYPVSHVAAFGGSRQAQSDPRQNYDNLTTYHDISHMMSEV